MGLGFVCVPFSGRGACSVVITRPWIDAMGIYIMVGGATGWAGWAGWARPTQNFGWVGHSAFGLTNNCPVCSLIIRKISKIRATGCQILRLKYPKFAFCWGFAPDPAGGGAEIASNGFWQ